MELCIRGDQHCEAWLRSTFCEFSEYTLIYSSTPVILSLPLNDDDLIEVTISTLIVKFYLTQ